MTEPPIKIREIVFTDDTHFLDHRIGSRYCQSINGTRRKSVRLHWHYLRTFKHTWDQRLVHRAFCRFGRHDMSTWYNNTPPAKERRICLWCNHEGFVR